MGESTPYPSPVGVVVVVVGQYYDINIPHPVAFVPSFHPKHQYEIAYHIIVLVVVRLC